jgi:hypothetical protein
MPKKKDDDGGKNDEFQVDTAELRNFATTLFQHSSDLVQPLTDLGLLDINPGDERLYPPAQALRQKLWKRVSDVTTAVTALRSDLDYYGGQMSKIADMYDRADDDNKAEAEGLMPLISGGKIVPGSAAPPPATPPPTP